MKYCVRCGEAAELEDHFCKKCGNKLDKPDKPDEPKSSSPKDKVVGFCKSCGRARLEKESACSSCGEKEYSSAFGEPEETRADVEDSPVSNTIAWWIAFTPLIGLVAANAAAILTQTSIQNIAWITLALNVALCWWDQSKIFLSHPGFNGQSFYLVPVYLFKRAKFFKHSLAYFFVWLVTFAAVMFIPNQYILNNPMFNLGLGSASTVSTVKDGHLIGYESTSIGEAIHNYLDEEKWTSFITDGGDTIVQVTGTLNDAGKAQTLLIQFLIDKENSTKFALNAGSLDDKVLSEWDLYGNIQAAYAK